MNPGVATCRSVTRRPLRKSPRWVFFDWVWPFLKIHDLRIDLDARWARKETLLDLFQKVSSKRGVRYAVAEPIELVIRPQAGDAFRITATKGKFTSEGALRVWGDVQVVRGETSNRRTNLSLTADPLSNSSSFPWMTERKRSQSP